VREAGLAGGAVAALAGDELVGGEAAQRRELAHHDRLLHAELRDARAQIRERLHVVALAAQLLDVGLARRDRGERDELVGALRPCARRVLGAVRSCQAS
jgi:hypothetical protein